MIEYLNDRTSITKEDFISSFKDHLRGDGHEDELFEFHNKQIGLQYFRGFLNEQGIENLVLPHHAVELEPGRSPDRPVKTGGELFNTIIQDYITNFIPNNRFVNCFTKATEQGKKFFNQNDGLLRADFIFVTNDKKIAHLNADYNSTYPSNCIFIGNGFHRMIAYGLFINSNGFKPLEVHYVKNG